MGTYNFFGPDSDNHKAFDMNPYFIGGNTSDDPNRGKGKIEMYKLAAINYSYHDNAAEDWWEFVRDFTNPPAKNNGEPNELHYGKPIEF